MTSENTDGWTALEVADSHAFMLHLTNNVVWCAYDGWAAYVPFDESYSAVTDQVVGYQRQIAAMQTAWLEHIEDETGEVRVPRLLPRPDIT